MSMKGAPPVVKIDKKEDLLDLIGGQARYKQSVRNVECTICGRPCGKKIWFEWRRGKRLCHYPKCKLLKRGTV